MLAKKIVDALSFVDAYAGFRPYKAESVDGCPFKGRVRFPHGSGSVQTIASYSTCHRHHGAGGRSKSSYNPR